MHFTHLLVGLFSLSLSIADRMGDSKALTQRIHLGSAPRGSTPKISMKRSAPMKSGHMKKQRTDSLLMKSLAKHHRMNKSVSDKLSQAKVKQDPKRKMMAPLMKSGSIKTEAPSSLTALSKQSILDTSLPKSSILDTPLAIDTISNPPLVRGTIVSTPVLKDPRLNSTSEKTSLEATMKKNCEEKTEQKKNRALKSRWQACTLKIQLLHYL